MKDSQNGRYESENSHFYDFWDAKSKIEISFGKKLRFQPFSAILAILDEKRGENPRSVTTCWGSGFDD